jgi:subtilisin family serine protease
MSIRKLLINKVNAVTLRAIRGSWGSAPCIPAVVAIAILAVPQVSLAEVGTLVAGPGFIEEKVEDAVESQVEEEIGEAVDESLQDAVEEQVADQVEERIGQLVAGPGFLEEKIEERVEEAVEEQLADTVEDVIEGAVEETVVTIVEQDVEEDVQDSIEDTIEESIEESVQDSVEETIAVSVESGLENNVEEAVEESVAAAVEETIEESVQDEVAVAVEETVEESVAATVEASVEAAVAGGVEAGLEQSIEREVEAQVADAVEDRIESDIIERIESGLEIDEDRIRKGQWLVMAEPEVFDELAEEGYLFDTVTELPGMGLRLAEVAAPSSFDISEVRQGVVDVVGSDRVEVDLNHIYTAGNPQQLESSDQGVQPRAAIRFPDDLDELALRIGMIDSGVDTTHPSLSHTRIQSRAFVGEGARLPEFHGTAIASILAADAPDYRGLAPKAEVYAAAVFEQDQERGEIASTVSLVRALDWLISSGVDVVNVSLAGPPNRLLEAALRRAAEREVMVLAAAGNGGPAAQPMYPAAYDMVVAVTAVDSGGQVFRLANRGSYLDLAAPGVGLVHARAGGGYTASSGTSFAVPFAAAAAARLRHLQPGQDVLQLLLRSAEDLGPPGRDEIYGYGLLRPVPVSG